MHTDEVQWTKARPLCPMLCTTEGLYRGPRECCNTYSVYLVSFPILYLPSSLFSSLKFEGQLHLIVLTLYIGSNKQAYKSTGAEVSGWKRFHKGSAITVEAKTVHRNSTNVLCMVARKHAYWKWRALVKHTQHGLERRSLRESMFACYSLSVVHCVNFIQVENSRFCRPDILKKLTDAVSSAQVCI